MRPTLYRVFDSEDRLLYIGASINRLRRVDYHFSHQPWTDEIATITFEHFPDRAALAQAEIQAIRKERPRYNCTHNPASPRRIYGPRYLKKMLEPITPREGLEP